MNLFRSARNRRMLALAPLCLFAGLQLISGLPRGNPPVIPSHRMEANVRIPPQTRAILYRACGNCHSNETRWPWYSHIAPASWMLSRDVEKARKVFNLSEWSQQSGRRPDLAASMLLAICADVKTRRMPSAAYLFLHPEARVSPAEAQNLCVWTNQEALRLQSLRRSLSHAGNAVGQH